jgi:hypothetical protein
MFRVRVPKDFGDRSLTWSITANGHTEKVVAKLLPAYEKDERFIQTNNSTTIVFGEDDANTPPTITVPPIAGATARAPVTLTALVTDDGLPKPRPARPAEADRAAQQSGGPDPLDRFRSQRNNNGPARLTGPRVTWQVYRAAGAVTIEQPVVPVTGGRAVTTARFATPGRYVLIATAGDGKLNTIERVTIEVK